MPRAWRCADPLRNTACPRIDPRYFNLNAAAIIPAPYWQQLLIRLIQEVRALRFTHFPFLSRSRQRAQSKIGAAIVCARRERSWLWARGKTEVCVTCQNTRNGLFRQTHNGNGTRIHAAWGVFYSLDDNDRRVLKPDYGELTVGARFGMVPS